MTDLPAQRQLKRFKTAAGADIFQIPLLAFPDFWVNAYLVLFDGYRVLVDCGSGYGESDPMLTAALDRIARETGQPTGIEDLTHILITHGHIDHFGGLVNLAGRIPAQIVVHQVDQPLLTDFETHIQRNSLRLRRFLRRAGLSPQLRRKLEEMYQRIGTFYRSVRVDLALPAPQGEVGPFMYLHTPGHAAGHVVYRLHDVLFVGDHVLADISPHQSPAELRPQTGLGPYLKSLEALLDWAHNASFMLSGHDGPIDDISGRVHEIQQLHRQRLARVLTFLQQPHTIEQVSQFLFGSVDGYNVLLALEEAGAHVEYLHQQGSLIVREGALETNPAASGALWFQSAVAPTLPEGPTANSA